MPDGQFIFQEWLGYFRHEISELQPRCYIVGRLPNFGADFVNIVTIQLQESAETPRLIQWMDFDPLEIFDYLNFQNVSIGKAHNANWNAAETSQLSGAESPCSGHDLEVFRETFWQRTNQERGEDSLGLD